MRSADRGQPDRDRSATSPERIRDAAITCIAERGVAGASVRAIARTAGVSPALVIHHFGSKDALRVACDQHVAALIVDRKHRSIAEGTALDPLASLRSMTDGPPVVRYLARTLADGSPHAGELVLAMVRNDVAVIEHGVEAGLLHPTEDEWARVAVLTVWSLGALVLHEHVQRLLGEDLTGDPRHAARYLSTVVDLLGRPVFTEAAHRELRDGLAAMAAREGSRP